MKTILTKLTTFQLLLSLSVNAQNFWIDITSPCLWASTNYMYVTSSNRIIASGCNPPRYSDNNGDNWTIVTGFSGVFNKIVNSSNNDIYAATNMGVWKSTNLGATWSIAGTLPGSQNISDIAVNSNDNLFILKGGVIFQSTNYGMTWDTVNADYTSPKAISIAINSDDDIFIGTDWIGSGGEIYRSTDNGTTWTAMSAGLFSSGDVHIIEINKNNDIFVGTSGMGIYRSIDNGTNWINCSSGGIDSWIEAIVINSQNIIFVSTPWGIYQSFSNGNTWINITSNISSPSCVRALAINSNNYLFTGTNDCNTYRSINSVNSGIKEIANLQNNLFANNYPNPFTMKTVITFSVPEEDKYTIKIFNIRGQELFTQVEEVKNDEYILIFDASDLQGGFYFYQISSSIGTTTNKMILLR